MVEPNVAITRSMGLEALQNRSRDLRRARPPDITILRNELKVPLRPEGLTKRESRIGLRNIFSKSKTGKDDRIPEGASFPRETSRHGGIRNSLAEIGNWPQRLQPSRSELSLLSSPPTSLKSPASKAPLSPAQPRQNSNGIGKSKLRPPVPPKTRGSVTTFDPPPLFKMYPQAIKHATLPTCVASIDALARLSESKSSLLRNESSRSDLALDQIEASGLERKGESERKKKSKSTPEWTSKIYALVTSGYLLQYAAEGPFDRLPEKILQLTRDSAAYATDLIPGRHWVIRVASFTDANGNPSSDTKSFRSKLALRGVEKRQISNMLLVFKSPEAMDAWLAILRREIESLGGKKKLSETGKAEVDDDATMLKAQASQRTLVVRDPDRFSRIVSQDFSWTQENALIDPNENDSANPRMSESTLDDGSTLSMVSLDGQRLDSLRDSGSGNSGNRFSFVSSGQPTIVSSPGSSPINSPIRECFPSHGDDYQSQPIQASLPPPTQEVRPRPNAAAIVNRRQSMQMMIPGFDSRIDIGGHSHSALPTTLPPVHEIKPQFVPNFSVPHTVNRRYSAMNLPRADRPQTSSPDEPVRPLRRSPPTTLAISRPLSIVLDQPSPRSPRSPRSAISPYSPTVLSNQNPALKAPDSPSIFKPRVGNAPKPRTQEKLETSKRNSGIVPKQAADIAQPSNRNTANIEYRGGNNPRNSRQDSVAHPRPGINKPYIIQSAQAEPRIPTDTPDPIRRASSSLEMRREWAAPTIKQASYKKRTTIIAENSTSRNRHSFIYAKKYALPPIEEPLMTPPPPPPPKCSPKRSAPSLRTSQGTSSPSKQSLTIDVSPRTLLTRRSLPHLVDGPPPAPPPTCALPPIPKQRANTPTPRSFRT